MYCVFTMFSVILNKQHCLDLAYKFWWSLEVAQNNQLYVWNYYANISKITFEQNFYGYKNRHA